MIQITIDVSEAVKGLKEAGEDFREIVAAGFSRANAEIVRRFQENQLSGRRSENYGLNIRSGRLRDSIKSSVEIAQSQVKGTIFNKGATYWEYHQEGEGNNPKRLYFYEEFETTGQKLYESEIEMAIAKVSA